MSQRHSIQSTQISRGYMLEQIKTAKAQGTFKVIDIGGEAGAGWNAGYVDAMVDINGGNNPLYNFDICKPQAWQPLLDHVAVNGKFDYAICTHTLEDIYDPFVVLDNLGKIALRGGITTPSVRAELSHVEHPAYRGFIHHRWIVTGETDHLQFAPKLGVVEVMPESVDYRDDCGDIFCEWTDSISWTVINGNYFDSPVEIITLYQELLRRAQTLEPGPC